MLSLICDFGVLDSNSQGRHLIFSQSIVIFVRQCKGYLFVRHVLQGIIYITTYKQFVSNIVKLSTDRDFYSTSLSTNADIEYIYLFYSNFTRNSLFTLEFPLESIPFRFLSIHQPRTLMVFK